MIAARDFGSRDTGTGPTPIGRLDGNNDGLWCQSAMNVSNIGSWKLPDGSTVPVGALPIDMANRPGQVGLLRSGAIGLFPYQGLYTCTIPDEHGVNQTLVVWAAGNGAYDGSNQNCEFKPNFIT